jgi:hypothetical protein
MAKAGGILGGCELEDGQLDDAVGAQVPAGRLQVEEGQRAFELQVEKSTVRQTARIP